MTVSPITRSQAPNGPHPSPAARAAVAGIRAEIRQLSDEVRALAADLDSRRRPAPPALRVIRGGAS